MTFLFGLITFWDKCYANMSLGFNYFTAFPVLIQYISAAAILLYVYKSKYIQNEIFLEQKHYSKPKPL